MTQHEFPLVAIVSSNPLRRDIASGMMMRSLFEGWPQDRLAHIYFPVLANESPELDVCRDVRCVRTTGRVRRFNTGQRDENRTAVSSGGRGRVLVQRLRRRPRVHRWLKLGQEAWHTQPWFGRVLRRELSALRPDIVYALVGNRALTRLVCRACERLELPMFLHVTDDFVESLYEPLPFGRQLQRSSDGWFRRAVAWSSGRAGIGPAMADEFGRRYASDWDWFATLVDPAIYDPAPRAADQVRRFVFTGNLGLERWRTLRKLAIVLQSIHRSLPCRLCIYAPDEQLAQFGPALNVPPIVKLHGWAPADALPRIYHDSDILVHAESFEPTAARYTRLSFSTKLSQYMMAGRAILALGPESLSALEMVRQIGAGVATSTVDEVELHELLRQLLADTARQREYGSAGRQWAERWLSTDAGRKRFRAALARPCLANARIPA